MLVLSALGQRLVLFHPWDSGCPECYYFQQNKGFSLTTGLSFSFHFCVLRRTHMYATLINVTKEKKTYTEFSLFVDCGVELRSTYF